MHGNSDTHDTGLHRLFSRSTCRKNARARAVATAHKQLPNLSSEPHQHEVLRRRSAGSRKCALSASEFMKATFGYA